METRVDLTLTDNASAAARRAAEGLGQVATAADEINSSLDPNVLDAYNQKLTEIGEAYSKLDRGMKLRDQYQTQQTRQMTGMIQSVSGGLVQAGRGDVAGGMLSGVKSLAGMAGKIVGPAALAIAGLAVGGSKLADIYGERAVPAQRIAALEGAMGTDIEANTIALMDAMKSTKDSVAKYGKTFEEGARARETFLRAGGRDFAESSAAAYSLAMAADFGGLAAFTGMGQRYGQRGGLDVVNALMSAQGLGTGQFEEVMGGLQDTFTSFLSRGIIRSIEDIGISQEYFGRLGPAWQGALGAQRLQGMNQAVAGAAGLEQQSDLFLYRAAAGITAKTGGGIIETQMLLERGLTPELFQGLMGQFGQMGYGREETIKQLQRTLKIGPTAAYDLYGLAMGGEVSKESLREAIAAGQGVTITTGYIETIEDVKQWVSELGEGFYELRTDAIDGTIEGFKELITTTEKVKGWFEDLFDVSEAEKGLSATAASQIAEREANDRAKKELQIASRFRSSVALGQATIPGVSDFYKRIQEAERAGVDIRDIYTTVGSEYQKAIISGGTISQSEGEMLITLLTELIEVNKTTAKNTGEDIEFEDKRETSGSSTFSGYRDRD